MRLDLGNINCIYCDSQNLEFCEWYDGVNCIENPDDICFLNEVDEIVQKNFSNSPEQEYLFHCMKCNNWFTFESIVRQTVPSLLAFIKEQEITNDCYLVLDPISLEPIELYVYNYCLSIIDYSFSIRKESIFAENIGPFYPYPLGEYNLVCSIDESIIKSPKFRIKIKKDYISTLIWENNIDLEFFRFSIDWYDLNAEKVLLQLAKMGEDNQEKRIIDKISKDNLNSSSFLFNSMPIEISKNISSIASLLRNQQAYRFLNWLENTLRNFLWTKYQDLYTHETPKWWMGCFPKEVIDKINDNKNNELKIRNKIESKFPLEYADFDNLLSLFEKEWDGINGNRKKDIDIFNGHFNYIKNLRNSIAHNRDISHNSFMELQSNAIKLMDMIETKNLNKLKIIFYMYGRI